MVLVNIIHHIGYNGPIILLFLSSVFLRNKRKMLFIYWVGSFINVLINYLLKMIIKEPRPLEDNVDIEWINRNGIDKYGMPSGHAQMVFFSCSFLYYVLNDVKLLLLFLLISINTISQRYSYKNHTFNQLIIGSIVGSLVGYLFYCIGTLYLGDK
jgi:membrane-associated phospholipid phosphatase